MNITIKPYQDIYRLQVEKIAADTARKSFTKTPKKREAICLMFVDYYIDYEPDSCFVAVDENEEVLGYIVSFKNNEQFKKISGKTYGKRLFRINPIYAIFNYFQVNYTYKINKKYGGSFHINITQKAQGAKIGARLLKTLADHTRQTGGHYLNLVTQNKKTNGYKYYTHLGFQVVEKHFSGSLTLIYHLDDNKGYLDNFTY